jgi:hypothetical protein
LSSRARQWLIIDVGTRRAGGLDHGISLPENSGGMK